MTAASNSKNANNDADDAAPDYDCSSSAAASLSLFHHSSESATNPPSLACSSSETEQQHHQQQHQRSSKSRPQQAQQHQQQVAACNDEATATTAASIFDNAASLTPGGMGGWVSDTVQSAVTHFFGDDSGTDQKDDEPRSIRNNASPQNPTNPSTSNAGAGCARPLRCTTSTTEAEPYPFQILGRARSYSPSFSLFPSDAGCGLYHHLQCDKAGPGGPGNATTTTTSNGDGDTNNNEASASPYHPHFLPSDFNSQTWLSVLHDHPSAYYYGAGAGVILTAVIVIHPLALIGAAATAAVSAGAMWAVGFFHQVDKGYQIWNEEFGMLFWEDNDASAAGADDASVAAGQVIAATVTTESNAIIQKDEEHLRRVFLLEQEHLKSVSVEDDMVQVAEAEAKEDPERVLQDDAEANEEISSSEQIPLAAAPEDTYADANQFSKSTKGMRRLQQRQDNKQLPGKEYILRRIKSAPVKALEKPSVKRRVKKQRQPKTKITVTDSSSSKPPTVTAQDATPAESTLTLSSRTTTTQTTPAQKIESHSAPRTKNNIEMLDSQAATIDSHFPSLEICVTRRKALSGLNTAEFFEVFFADDAPYSFKDFQKTRGDVDIDYGSWGHVGLEGENENGSEGLYSFKEGDNGAPNPLPPKSTQQRTLKFNTLTKSYFGPAYAKATKTQRATQLSDHVLVIENVTQLADIPFSDRFRVVERWVVEAVRNDHAEKQLPSRTTKNDNDNQQQQQPLGDSELSTNNKEDTLGDAQYTCHLSIHAEVQMLKPCSWESQIRKKASETFTQVAKEWCKSATAALKAAEEQKRKRLEKDFDDVGSNSLRDTAASNAATANRKQPSVALQPLSTCPPQSLEQPRITSPLARESELFEKHRRNFQKLDKLMAKGDIEECSSIEVMHSFDAGRRAAFAKVLEFPSTAETELVEVRNSDPEEITDGIRKKPATVLMRSRSRRLFKKLSSRVSTGGNRSKQQPQRSGKTVE